MIIDFNLQQGLGGALAVAYWHGQPLWALGGFDAIPITPTVFIKLDIIIQDKDIASYQLIKETKPGEVSGLQYDHGSQEWSSQVMLA